MLTFDATPDRVREATKLAYRHGVQLAGVQEFWAAQPQHTQIPGFAFTLKTYQAQGVAFLERWNGNVMLADAPGLGKTAQVMAYAWRNRKWPMLVIMPKTLLLNWRQEITSMLGSQLSVLIVGHVPSARKQVQLKQQWPHVHFAKQPEPGHDVTLINYDIVARNQHRLEQIGYSYVVLDESHKIKSIKAARTQAVMRLVTGREQAEDNRTWITHHEGVASVTFCSGTPYVNSTRDLWNVVSVCAPWVPQFSNFFKFGMKYCAGHKTRFGWDFTGRSHEDELNQILTNTILLRRLKQDVLPELPAKTFITVPLEFNRAEYDAVAQAFEGKADWRTGMDVLIAHGGNPAQSSQEIVAINKCREIAAYAKLNSACEWILDFVEGGHKLVVFAHHQAMVDQVYEQVKRAGVGVRKIRGGVKLEDRAQAAQDFQTLPDVKVIVLNIASAGYGITLTAASACAFLQLPWTAADLIQCSDRVHRIGQPDNVTVYNLVAENTVEQVMGEIIMEKAAGSNLVLDGGTNRELNDLTLTV